MKTLKPFLLAFLFILFTQVINAQTKTAAFKVAGECGMCKKKIETAAKDAGATYAVWDISSKSLKVKYAGNASNEAKIQQSIAAVGYDTPNYKATDAAYEKLHECCKYERTAVKEDCCKGASCTKEECKTCCADGKCSKDAVHAASSNEPMSCCAKS